MESFFGSLKTELDSDSPFETRQAARTAERLNDNETAGLIV